MTKTSINHHFPEFIDADKASELFGFTPKTWRNWA